MGERPSFAPPPNFVIHADFIATDAEWRVLLAWSLNELEA
jgi:hypothetical protein